MRSPTSSDHRDDGQATVELALCLPLLCMFLLAIVQLTIVVRDQLAVQAAAQEGARAAMVAASPGAAAEAAVRRSIALAPLIVSTDASSGTVTVDVAHVTHTDVPLIGALLPDVTVRANATMALEPP
jgi:Flp pilus assembly protein TadG